MDKENNNNGLMVFAFDKVELPKFKESSRYDWVPYGDDNLFPDKLTELYKTSALHNAICTTKVNDVIGNGFSYDGAPDPNTDEFLAKANRYEDWDSVLRKVAWDLILYGGYALNVIWSKDKTKIAEVYHIDFAKVRQGKKNERKMVDTYYYSDDWTKRKSDIMEIPAFSRIPTQENSQLYYYTLYSPGVDYYALPSYIGALASVQTDAEISNFHLSHIKNGMTPNIIINFANGVPTEEERRKIERQIKDKYVGTDNAGKFILTFSQGTDSAPTVTTLSPSQLDKQFIQLQDSVLQNILSGHSVVSPLLVGIPTPVGLGGTTILTESWQLYYNRVIQPNKNIILDAINKIGSINKIKELTIETSAPIEFTYSESILQNILTVNELRANIGYEPIEETVEETIEEPIEETNITE